MRRTLHMVDLNQRAIVKVLEKIPGVTVWKMDQYCDLLIGFRHKNFLIEIKNPDVDKTHRQLTPGEWAFHEKHTGQVDICYTLEDVLKIIELNSPTHTKSHGRDSEGTAKRSRGLGKLLKGTK